MTDARLTTTRRAVLTAALALPAAGIVASIPTAAATSVDTAAWDRALAAYRSAEAIFRTAHDAFHEAEEQASAFVPPRPDKLIDEYGLFFSMKRDRIEQTLRYHLPNDDQVAERTRIADQFESHERQSKDAARRFDTQGLWRQAKLTDPAFHATRDALMQVPAPTLAALLIKIEIAGISLDEEHGDAMVADARRLLSREV